MEDDEEESSKVLIRTITSYLPSTNKALTNILDFSTHQSKNAFNTFIFYSEIYCYFKSTIFKELYRMVLKKIIKSPSHFDDAFYELFDVYLKQYMEIRPFITINNITIYKFIIENLKGINLVNNNFAMFEKFITETLEKSNSLQFPDNCTFEHKKLLFNDIIYAILRSIYNKNFNKTKEEILAKQKCSINDKEFIEQVKNDEYLLSFDDKSNNCKTLLSKNDFFKDCDKKDKIKSDENYISRIVYKYYTDVKIPSDLLCNIMKKAYESYKSYFSLKAKGMKVNKTKYLPKDGHFILPFFKRSFKEVTISNNREIKQRKAKNKNNKKNGKKKNNKKSKKKKNKKKDDEEIIDQRKQYYRLTIGFNVANEYVEVIDDDDYRCINPDQNTEYKKYINKKHLLLVGKKKITKKDNYIFDNYYLPKNSSHIINAYYLYFKKPPILNKDNIKKLEIVPLYNGYRYKIVYNYAVENTENKPVPGKIISIDLGMVNLMTIYDPNGEQFIIKGGTILYINHFYNWLIDNLKSELSNNKKSKTEDIISNHITQCYNEFLFYCENNFDKEPIRATKNDPFYKNKMEQIKHVMSNNYDKSKGKPELTSKRIRNLWIKRKNLIDDYFDKVVSWIVNKYSDCSTIIVGYNRQWKQNVNMGKKNNRDFCEIPYARLLKKLRDRLQKNNQTMVEVEESYTSKCDALSLEPIKKQTKYMGKRTKRGLFNSAIGALINADLNGAINIMRKWYEREGKKLKVIRGKGLYNPKIVKINKPAMLKDQQADN